MALSSELRKLIKKRSIHMSSVEAIKRYVDTFNISLHSIRQVSIRLTKLNDLMDAYYSVQDSILALDEDYEQAKVDEQERFQFEDLYYTLKADMEDIVAKQTKEESTTSTHSSHISMGESIRLPTIQPPTFDGKLEDWSSFIDTFNALFHNNSTLNDVQRLHYLKCSVIGSAADIIKNFSITADNYIVAYNELIRQYENKALTTQSHIRSLLQTPKATHASANELRKLHHHVASHVRALKALGRPVEHWDDWLVTLICGQLDPTTAGEWQLLQDNKEMPTYENIEVFLSKRVSAYEAGLITNRHVEDKNHRSKNNINNKSLFVQSSINKYKCPVCSGNHKIYMCEQFDQKSPKDKQEIVAKNSLCFNCLNFGHQVKSCRYPGCPKCGKKHNSKLHQESQPQQLTDERNNSNQTTLYTEINNIPKSDNNLTVMLSTAIVHIRDNYGRVQECRAVLDSGSQLNFITASCISKLGLSHSPCSFNINGVGSMSSTSNQIVQATIASRFNNPEYKITLHSLPVIVKSLPSQPVVYPVNVPDHIKDQLADPQFHVPGPIDILLGAEVFYDLLGRDKYIISNDIVLYQTSFGWIVTGKLLVAHHNALSMLAAVSENVMPTSMVPYSALSLLNSTIYNKLHSENVEEEMVEKYFQQTTTRGPNGQFIVRLPLKNHPSCLGDTSMMAKRRFLSLEKKLNNNSALAKDYDECLMEYLALGHMVQNKSKEVDQNVCYLPHHAVVKNTSMTTKTRVVFDASAIGSAGLSLNDILMKGPTVQPTLCATLLRFRVHKIALTADIEKMYRQVVVHPDDCRLQKILYRTSPTDSLQEFTLQTVTFGTKTAPYLATRCLKELGQTCNQSDISAIILRDFYVDDLLTGAETVEKCSHIYNKITEVLSSAQFMLRKWCTNSPSILSHLPTNIDENYLLKLPEGESIGTLGMLWQPATDSFRFVMKPWKPPQHMTKRTLLSDINSVYDPIGLIAPLLVKGKIFIQQLWCLKLGWDEVLSTELNNKWTKFYSSLQRLSELSVPRRTLFSTSSIQLHGFCDASQVAYGACVYLRSIDVNGKVYVHLLTSKSRVAPLKATTIPRLELCGALLLAELVSEMLSELQLVNITIPTSAVYLWSDSKIVLAWIQSKCLFQVYVSNRIARIQDLTTPDQWNHVPTAENPADLISRGIDVETMISAELWWQGPQWLQQDQECWPSTPSLPAELPELRKIKLVLNTTDREEFWLLQRCSKWVKLIRTTALIQRFVSNCRAKILSRNRSNGFISLNELTKARCFWLAQAQSEFMSKELSELNAGKMVHRSCCLKSLNPFIDNLGLIRVGGRLVNAALHYNVKHPIVLPSKSLVSSLIFEYEHTRLLHVGPQALLAHISLTYWPIRGRQIATRTVRKCITCFRARPQFTSPIMAPLPKVRVTVSRPFASSGVDMCGPIMVRSGLRKVTPIKSYICVFVCMATRAIHLELVSSLSTEDFLAALSRFMSRRGQCLNLYSDNGTNFIGTDRMLKTYFKVTKKQKNVHDFLTMRDITWHFIPPAAPHFGGLWESAVQSAKKHLLRVAKGVLLTFEETITLLCKIEAALNSRPLYPLSSNPTDFSVLTPGHFLIGSPLMLPPEPDVSSVPQNRLKRYQLMQKQMQTFWKRWSVEYLPQLQQRGKWTKVNRNFKVGDLAILRDDSMPPLKWPLVRVTEIHPGVDGFVRAVTVRNSTGAEFKRPAVKLALLPTKENEDED